MKRPTLLFILCGCLLLSTPAHAQISIQESAYQAIAEIPSFEVVTLKMTYLLDSTRAAISITTTKEVTYPGRIIPDASIAWTETLNGTTYSGTLYRQSFYYNSTGNTVVTYKGTLYANI